MKKKLLFLFFIILLISCDKKKPILGVRKDIFLNNSIIEVEGDINNITIPIAKTFANYYGDGSTLNEIIENYRVENFNFTDSKISRKKFGVKTYFFSSPIIVDNIAYFLDTRGHLVARNLNSFDKNIWKTRIIEKTNFINYYGGKISFYNDIIYITTRLNEVIAVSSEDGSIIWGKKLNTVPISTPVIDGTTLYAITNDNKLYALDTYDGRIKWISFGNAKDSAILGSANPVIYKDYVVASYSSGELFIINKNNGENVFNMNITGKYMIYSNFELTDIDSTPVIVDNILIATANNGITAGINLDTMSVLWKQNLPSLTNILVSNSTIYMVTTDNIVIAMNAYDGKIYWFRELDKFKDKEKKKDLIFYRSLAMINGKIFAFNNVNEYKIINAKTGDIEDSITTTFMFYSVPFSLNDKIYGIGVRGRIIGFIGTR